MKYISKLWKASSVCNIRFNNHLSISLSLPLSLSCGGGCVGVRECECMCVCVGVLVRGGVRVCVDLIRNLILFDYYSLILSVYLNCRFINTTFLRQSFPLIFISEENTRYTNRSLIVNLPMCTVEWIGFSPAFLDVNKFEALQHYMYGVKLSHFVVGNEISIIRRSQSFSSFPIKKKNTKKKQKSSSIILLYFISKICAKFVETQKNTTLNLDVKCKTQRGNKMIYF